MGKRKSKLLKDSGSARRAIEEKCGGAGSDVKLF